MADQTNIPVTLQAKIDEKSIAQATARFKDLQRQLKGMGVDWGKVAKYATSATTEIQAISDAAAAFSKKLGMATMDSVGHLKKLGDQLEDAQQKAEELSDAYKGAESGAREGIAKQMGEQAKEVAKLTQQIHEYRSAQGKQIQQLNKLIKVQDRYQKSVTDAAKFDTGDMFEGIKNKLASGNLKGLFGDIGGGIKKSIEGKISRGAMERAAAKGGMGTEAGAAEIASAAKMMSGAGLALGASVAAFGAFVMLVKAASDHMTGLNKALINGMGYANDFVSDAKGYRGVMDEMRNAAIDSAGSMLKFGKNSEDVMKIINSYAKESTGSLIQTRETLKSLGGGDVAAGAKSFATNAILYGKALNMEGEEVAAMMGRFQSEIGYGAGQVEGMMEDVVKAARTSSMPMTKFMDIFKSVIPSVELYQNRLEELTGTIKLLSKTMSPKDVKQFMDAFSKGFSGTDFKQRLKTVLITGVGKVSGILEKGFGSKAETMAAQFEQYGIKKEDFMVAFKGGEKGMAKMVAEIQAKSGGAMSGTQIGEMMKLASYEAARQKGGPLNMATAMRGASGLDTYKILKAQSQTFTQGFDGLSEHVIQMTGISEQQYLALRQTHQSMEVWGEQMKKAGMTSSKSMNEAIRTRLGLQKGQDFSKKWNELSKDAQENLLFEASQQHDDEQSSAKTMEDLSQEQVSATTSISDKISNVIAFLLEKIYSVMQPILSLLDDMWSWLTGSKDQQEALKEIKSWKDDFTSAMETEAATAKTPQERDAARAKSAQYEEYTKKMEKLTSQGTHQVDMAQSMGMDKDWMKKNADAVEKAMAVGGGLSSQYNTIEKAPGAFGGGQMTTQSGSDLIKKLKEGTLTDEEVKTLQVVLGERHKMMALGKELQPGELATSKGASRRLGTEELAGPKNKKEAEAQRLADQARDFDAAYGAAMKMPVATPNAPAAPGTFGARLGQTVSGTRMGQTVYGPEAGLNQQQFEAAKTATSAPGTPGTKTAKAADTMTSLLEAIQAAGDSTVVQAMGISMHLDEIEKLLKGPGIHLNKTKFAQESVISTLKPMFDDSLATAFLDYFMYSAKVKDVESMLENAKNEGATTLKEAAKQWGTDYQNQYFPKPEGARDFGGKIDTTGYYRLMRGEEVVNPSLNGGAGAGAGRSVTINATINVNGSGDPRATAAIVRSTLYDMSEKH